MGKIIFVGSSSSGYFAEEVAKLRAFDFNYIEPKGNIKEQTNDILFLGKSNDWIIYDIEQYINPAEEIVEEIKTITMAINTQPIIFAPSFTPGSKLTTALIENDIKRFIVKGSATGLKDQLEKNMAGYFDKLQRKEIKDSQRHIEEEKKILKSFKTIGVSGACSRIGTTTQAIQIVKYLQMKGYKACLIELNENKYVDTAKGSSRELSFVEKIKIWFETQKEDEEIGLVKCFDVDMYHDQSQITKVLKLGYDFYVYDYGMYKNKGFNKMSFLREDIRIFVVGSGPTELDYTNELAQNSFYQDAKLLFSFTAENEKEDILDLMSKISQGSTERTYFAGYCPDAFSFSELKIYEELLPLEGKRESLGEKKTKKKSAGFFGRKKK
ncbi:MAG: hypothetical protein ACRCUS_10395 [Anaerovoracaceae bacterium]